MNKENNKTKASNFRRLQEENDRIPYGMTNDYMFRAVLQTSPEVLKGVLAALLEIEPSEIMSCEIKNPIILGDAINEKTCVLDVRVLLNNSLQINLEMQVGDLTNWPDRSLYYLCRMHTDLQKGENYLNARSSIHIGILTNTLFEDNPSFYSEYALLDTKTHYRYTGKFAIRVLQLNQLNNVPEEERNTQLYYWSKLFAAKTWKELEDMAEKSGALREAVVTLRQLSEDEQIKLQCEAREMYEMDQSAQLTLRQRAREEGRKEGIKAGMEQGHRRGLEEGYNAGVEKEHINTIREKERADAAERELEKLRKQLQEMKNKH